MNWNEAQHVLCQINYDLKGLYLIRFPSRGFPSPEQYNLLPSLEVFVLFRLLQAYLCFKENLVLNGDRHIIVFKAK